MVDNALLPAINAALTANEGAGDPYKLSFAKVGASGASFGVFQGDTAQNQNAATTLRNVLDAAGLDPTWIDAVMAELTKACPTDPLAPAEESSINSALHSPQGRSLVDALDAQSLASVLTDLGLCTSAAASNNNSINDDAQLAICQWCNMTSRPTLLLTWLRGSSVTPARVPVPAPNNPVAMADVQVYLRASTFFQDHPQNWQHFVDSVQVGVKRLPHAD